MKLVIVESPTKSKTIGKFLGPEYRVESSYGHIRDLPKSKLGIDIENNFEPQYVIPTKSRKLVNRLKKEAQKAEVVILASDEDREGEAISFHLVKALDLDKKPASKKTAGSLADSEKFAVSDRVQRIAFHEITKSAIEEALKNPRPINLSLVDAQQARRVLDRLVGYKLSPFLWEKVMKRLSAGRVQSAALRLIVEREEEIKIFKPQEYWTVFVILKNDAKHRPHSPAGEEGTQFEASLYKIGKDALSKFGIASKKDADKITADLEKAAYSVLEISKKETRRNPLPPFTTSSLQQESFKKLRYTARQTMRFAQSLYENGLITYMRTDSVNLSKESVIAAKNWLEKELGKEYAQQAPRFFKAKSKLAQEAHEAIRPTKPALIPDQFKSENTQEKKVYDLIWRRFMASQMPQAIFDASSAEISAKGKQDYYLRANGNTLKFDGFLKIWPVQFETKELPILKEKDPLKLIELNPSQHFTEPPPRYDEASLVKALEEYGIGRPSTYAPTISVIQDRNYVVKNEQRRFQPTEIGEAVNKILVGHFPQIVDIRFTAKMEDEFDEIAEGKRDWHTIIKEFYGPFAENLEKKYSEVEKVKPFEDKTDEICEKCGKPMIIKYGRFGKFLACSGFPECKNTKKIVSEKDKKTYGKCPKCGQGEIVRKRTKRGRFFYGCSRYPDCDYAVWKLPDTEDKKSAA